MSKENADIIIGEITNKATQSGSKKRLNRRKRKPKKEENPNSAKQKTQKGLITLCTNHFISKSPVYDSYYYYYHCTHCFSQASKSQLGQNLHQ